MTSDKLITTFKRIYYPAHVGDNLTYSDDVDTFTFEDLIEFLKSGTTTDSID